MSFSLELTDLTKALDTDPEFPNPPPPIAPRPPGLPTGRSVTPGTFWRAMPAIVPLQSSSLMNVPETTTSADDTGKDDHYVKVSRRVEEFQKLFYHRDWYLSIVLIL